MTSKQGKIVRSIRIVVQIIFLFLFFLILVHTGKSASQSFGVSKIFFYFDPFLMILTAVATHHILPLFLLSLIPILLTLICGRFFCGWVCPMGAIQQFFSWLFSKSFKRKEPISKKLLTVKYYVLIIIIVMAVGGTQIGGWLDPFSLLTRSSSTVVMPSGNYLVEEILKEGAKDQGLMAKALKPAYNFSRDHVLTQKQRRFNQSLFIGLIFLAIIGLNAYKRRFYCNYICPLGALFGLFSRFSLLKLTPSQACKSCNVCARNCTYNGSPYQDYMKSECLVCFNCAESCPADAIEMGIKAGKDHQSTVEVGRRKILTAVFTGLVVSILPRISNRSGAKRHPFLRPPGSVSENEFLDKCIRCGACIQACPTNFIQPTLFQAGPDGIWTPVLNPAIGYCEYECHRCTQVCPTEAIQKITLKAKKQFKIGTAAVDKNRCYTYADGYNCAVCEEHCPVPDKAIKFREVETWTFNGELAKVKQIYVDPDLCIGCGICENICPRSDAPGIFTTAEEEQREFTY